MERNELVRALQEINMKDRVSLYKREVCLKAADLIDAQAREIKALQKQLILRNDELLKLRAQVPQWVSVTERLPQSADGMSFAENVIAYLSNGNVEAQVCPGWLNGDVWYLIACDHDKITTWPRDAVTHWMPLPEPPKEDA